MTSQFLCKYGFNASGKDSILPLKQTNKPAIFEDDDCNRHNHVDFVHFEQCNDEAFCFKARFLAKGQIKPKADWHAVDSPKKLMNKFVLFAFLLFMVNKTNLFVRFLENLRPAQTAFDFI